MQVQYKKENNLSIETSSGNFRFECIRTLQRKSEFKPLNNLCYTNNYGRYYQSGENVFAKDRSSVFYGMTSEDLFQQILRYIPKDRRISLKVLKISNGTVDAIELVEHEVEVNPDCTKLIYIEFLKDNVRFYLTWHGHDKEF